MTLSSVKHQIVILDNMTNHNDMNLSSVKPQTVVADNTTLNNSCRTYSKQERYEQLICQTSNGNGRKYHNKAKLDNGNRSSVKPQTSCWQYDQLQHE